MIGRVFLFSLLHTLLHTFRNKSRSFFHTRIIFQLETKSKFRLMCEGDMHVFITHFLGYVVGIGVVGHIKCL